MNEDKTSTKKSKPLNHRAYGSIPHLPNSRRGPKDSGCSSGQAVIATERLRDWRDRVIVQEKIDGSCCAVAKIDRSIIALTRAGYRAATSPYEQHHLFDWWVRKNIKLFDRLLDFGERVVGEWIAQAHGTIYPNVADPFVAFDIMVGQRRMTYGPFLERVGSLLPTPQLLSYGQPISVECALSRIRFHDPEGAVWRVERDGEVEFLVKYVRADKIDGKYLPEITGDIPMWNWRPQ